jgi:tetratricopeptide (TPR) repeat protein
MKEIRPSGESLTYYLELCKKQLAKGMSGNEIEFEIFNTTISLYPNSGEAYFYRGEAFSAFWVNKNVLAERDYTRAIRLNYIPNKIYESRALVRTELKRFTLACDDYSKLIEIFPNSAKYYFWRGIRRLANQQGDLAEQDYLKSIAIDSKLLSGEVYAHLSDFYCKSKKYSKALDILKKGLAHNPKELFLIGKVADLKMEIGEYESAFKDYEFCMENDNPAPGYFKDMGKAKFKSRDYKTAINLYTEAIELDEDDSEAYLLRSKAWYQLLDGKNAFADCEKAKLLDPKYKEAFDYFGYLVVTLSNN